jgi:hypothetical protein
MVSNAAPTKQRLGVPEEPPWRNGEIKMAIKEFTQSPVVELEQTVERRIIERTNGRIRQLHVRRWGGRLIVRGRAPSYYTKQLAIQAAVGRLGE